MFYSIAHPQMVFFRDIGVGHHDLTPQNSALFLRVKSDVLLDLTQKSLFLDGHYFNISINYASFRPAK